jgi:hypothetical protein
MTKVRVLVAFEFEYISPTSPEEEAIIQAITEECETMRIAFDAQSCFVDEVLYLEAREA